MIRTEAEYQAAKKEAAARRDRLQAYQEKLIADGLTAAELKRALDPLETFALDVEDELHRYERLRAGDFHETAQLSELGKILIGLRISKRVTQRELATRLGVNESQVSRDERNEYHGVKVERVHRILAALDADCALLLTNDGTVSPGQSYAYVDGSSDESNLDPATAPCNDNLALAA